MHGVNHGAEWTRPEYGLQQRYGHAPIPGGARDVPSAFAATVARVPDAMALIGRHARYTYRELDAAVGAAAAALQGLGVRSGDRVAATTINDPDLVIAFLAAMRIGAIWAGVNRALAPPEKAYQLNYAGAKVYLADRESIAQIKGVGGDFPELLHIVDMEPGAADSDWAGMMTAYRNVAPPEAQIDPDAPAGLGFTSGTTGLPKGAVHSQHNMLTVAVSRHAGLRGPVWRPDMRTGVTLPLTILNMMVLDVVTPFSGGGSLVCMDRLDALGVAEWIETEQVETISLAPATAFDLIAKPEITPKALATLVAPVAGGAKVTDELRAMYREKFGRFLITGYGLTEAPTSVSSIWEGRPAPPQSVGRAAPHLDVRILDAEGREAPANEAGEICVRAANEGPWANVYTCMLGYWRRPEETEKTLKDGWLHTGDIGVLDAEGDLFIKDRLKELIIRGGANIYPAEIERVLTMDPRVREAAVIGRPDARLGETVLAVIELAAGAPPPAEMRKTLEQLCLAQLAKYKLPVDWVFVDEMPRNAMNKVVKPRLRELYATAEPAAET
ncbi:MAG: acyl--CoA ligase [Caulobacteraceae bacterium]|nr:acyl--CoA ligase [Caulobacteraceae bacterium]